MARASIIIAALAAACTVVAAAQAPPAQTEPEAGDGLSPLTRKVLGAGLPRPGHTSACDGRQGESERQAGASAEGSHRIASCQLRHRRSPH